jgi:amidohydrolase
MKRMKEWLNRLDELYPDMQEWRRYLHQYPELSYMESETASFVADRLRAWGIEPSMNVGGHGVAADIEGGRPGPTVALRADMDALPIQDEKTCEYRSRIDGVMHACGHDGHTSTLLGIARTLQEHRGELPGRVRLIFQPAEEISPGGAQPMIEAGVLEGVDVIYGVHLWTPLPVGTFASRSGPFMAAADEFNIKIAGKGGHGGLPHETIDSVVIASHLVVNVQSIISRNVNPVEPAVISVGSIHAGKGFNVIAESAVLNGTVRSFSEDVRSQLHRRLSEVAEQTAAMFGATAVVETKWGYPVVANHPAEAERFFNVARRLFEPENVIESPPIMAGEDFAYYLRRVPGVFMFVGAGNAEQGIVHPHHHPRFDIDENAMRHAGKLLLAMTWEYLYAAGRTA